MSNSAVMTRRRFMSLGKLDESVPVRPPWALVEDQFVLQCSQCGECVAACPEQIITRGRFSRYPKVNFSNGECTFCRACVDICPTPALDKGRASPWRMMVVVGDACLAMRHVVCVTCGERCAVRAIRFTRGAGRVPAPEIDRNICTGCGACVAPCPSQALEVVYEQ